MLKEFTWHCGASVLVDDAYYEFDVKEIKSMVKRTLFTKEDVKEQNWQDVNLEGLYIILDERFFKEEYRDAKYQLVKVTGGFGCDPQKIGNAIFVKECIPNGETYRIERCNGNKHILGLATDNAIKDFKEVYGWYE